MVRMSRLRIAQERLAAARRRARGPGRRKVRAPQQPSPYNSRVSLRVQKYGGTSVDGPERIRAVAQRVAASRAAGHDTVVVVSAMGRATDDLIALAHRVSSAPSRRELD